MPRYAILGATGNCGSALVELLLQRPTSGINAYCRNKAKLLDRFPDLESTGRVEIFQGGISDTGLLASSIRGCSAVFLTVSTNVNVPGLSVGQETARAVVSALRLLRDEGQAVEAMMPKLVLLSSATVDDRLSRNQPVLLRKILLLSASNVYADLRETEKILRAEESWITTIYIKPGALSVDRQRGHMLSLTEENGPLSYLDLAAGMLEAVDDEAGRYDLKNVSVIPSGERARFPTGTPMCILTGLLRHFFPSLHPYLSTSGP